MINTAIHTHRLHLENLIKAKMKRASLQRVFPFVCSKISLKPEICTHIHVHCGVR